MIKTVGMPGESVTGTRGGIRAPVTAIGAGGGFGLGEGPENFVAHLAAPNRAAQAAALMAAPSSVVSIRLLRTR